MYYWTSIETCMTISSPGWRSSFLCLWPRHHRCIVLDGHRAQGSKARDHWHHSSLCPGHHLRLYARRLGLASSHHSQRGHQRLQQGLAYHHDVQQRKLRAKLFAIFKHQTTFSKVSVMNCSVRYKVERSDMIFAKVSLVLSLTCLLFLLWQGVKGIIALDRAILLKLTVCSARQS